MSTEYHDHEECQGCAGMERRMVRLIVELEAAKAKIKELSSAVLDLEAEAWQQQS